MANVAEVVQYDAGIYQIETTDPVVGGAGGIANVQAKQLANRTAFLKQFADELVAARGGSVSLGARFTDSGVSTYDGAATILCRGVISGCDVSVTATPSINQRQVNLSAGRIYQGGVIVPINAQTNTAMIPTNTGGSVGTVELYLDNTGDLVNTNLNEASPVGTTVLRRVTVPAGNVANDLTGCTGLTTVIAAVEPNFPNYFAAAPSVTVTLPTPMSDTTYTVALEVDSFVGNPSQMNNLTIVNKTTTQFTIASNGTADSIAVRWLAR